MTRKDREKLQAKSLLTFGRLNHYKTIMRKGRAVFDKAGNFKHTAPITAQEIEDTMDYILKEREEKQKAILEEMNGGSRSEEHDESGDQRTQRDGSTKTSGESTEVSE